MNPPTERTPADKLNEIARAWLAPFGTGRPGLRPLEEQERTRLQTALDAPRPLPADPLEELVADLRRIQAEGGGPEQ